MVHGDVRQDDYYWMREKDNPDVIAYLTAENAYTDAVMKPTGAVPGIALRGDAGAHQGGRPVGALPPARLLLLLAHREGQAVPDLLPQGGQPGGARSR